MAVHLLRIRRDMSPYGKATIVNSHIPSMRFFLGPIPQTIVVANTTAQKTGNYPIL